MVAFMFKKVNVVFGIVLVLSPLTANSAGSYDEGRSKFYSCAGCHGIPGYSNAFPSYRVPRLGGQNKGSIISALNDYKSGVRVHGSMEGNANGLTTDDVEDIAVYLAGQKSELSEVPVTGDVVSGKNKAEACGACHGTNGISLNETIPTLAAQHESYLVNALKSYRTGRRQNAIMNGVASELHDSEILDIAAYYASQRKGLTEKIGN